MEQQSNNAFYYNILSEKSLSVSGSLFEFNGLTMFDIIIQQAKIKAENQKNVRE